MEIVCFKFKPKDKFEVDEGIDPMRAYEKIDWSNYKNSKHLSSILVKQINRNFINYDKIKKSCENKRDIEIINNDISFFPYDSCEELCNKFLTMAPGYEDTFIRDYEAIRQENFNVDIYAIVLLKNNTYYGHIYSWLSPIEKSFCIGMGIRSKIDNLFINKLNNISSYLLEGLRLFALHYNCDSIIINEPLLSMRNILLKLNFKTITLSEEVIGKSLNSDEGKNIKHGFILNCKNKLTDEDINFVIVNI
jgi:hypothetical protein